MNQTPLILPNDVSTSLPIWAKETTMTENTVNGNGIIEITPRDRGFSVRINHLIASFGAVLARGLMLLERTINLPEWGWIDNELAAFGYCQEMGVTEEEASRYATASCLPDLWVLRAWAAKRGVPVPRTDWAYYTALERGWIKDTRNQVEFIRLANIHGLVGGRGRDLEESLKEVPFLEGAEFEFTREGDSIARLYFEGPGDPGCLSVYCPE